MKRQRKRSSYEEDETKEGKRKYTKREIRNKEILSFFAAVKF
jgi:hypothetical protein